MDGESQHHSLVHKVLKCLEDRIQLQSSVISSVLCSSVIIRCDSWIFCLQTKIKVWYSLGGGPNNQVVICMVSYHCSSSSLHPSTDYLSGLTLAVEPGWLTRWFRITTACGRKGHPAWFKQSLKGVQSLEPSACPASAMKYDCSQTCLYIEQWM